MKIFICTAFVLASLGQAADTPTEMLSWQDAVRLTAQNNADLLAAQADVRAAEFQEGGARSGFYPSVSASVDYTFIQNSGLIKGSNKAYGAGVSATQNLFGGFSDYGKEKKATAEKEVARANLRIVKAQVSYDLKGAFQGMLYAKEFEKLTINIMKRRDENLRLVQLRYESGNENKGSVLLSQAYLKQAQYDDLVAKNSQRTAYSQLAHVLGRDIYAQSVFDIQGRVPIQDNFTAPDFQAAVVQTAEYEQAIAREKSAEASITVAKSNFYPSLNASAGIGRTGNDFFPDDQDRKNFGISLSIPLFDGGRDYYGTRAATSQYASASFSRNTVTQATLVKLEDNFGNYSESIAKLDADNSFRSAATVRAEIARKKYNTGLLSFEDWDVIENDLITRQKTALTSERDRTLAEAAWEQVQGKGVIP